MTSKLDNVHIVESVEVGISVYGLETPKFGNLSKMLDVDVGLES